MALTVVGPAINRTPTGITRVSAQVRVVECVFISVCRPGALNLPDKISMDLTRYGGIKWETYDTAKPIVRQFNACKQNVSNACNSLISTCVYRAIFRSLISEC